MIIDDLSQVKRNHYKTLFIKYYKARVTLVYQILQRHTVEEVLNYFWSTHNDCRL